MHNYPYPRIAGPRRRHPARQIKQFSAVVSALAAPSVTATAHRGRRAGVRRPDSYCRPADQPRIQRASRPSRHRRSMLDPTVRPRLSPRPQRIRCSEQRSIPRAVRAGGRAGRLELGANPQSIQRSPTASCSGHAPITTTTFLPPGDSREIHRIGRGVCHSQPRRPRAPAVVPSQRAIRRAMAPVCQCRPRPSPAAGIR
jgi:hypothetical protein